MEKGQARQYIRQQLANLNSYDKSVFDKRIFENLVASNLVHGNVLIYNALNSEVSTKLIIERYLKTTNLYMPVVVEDDMEFVLINEKTKYISGKFGIEEPIGERLKADEVNITVCVTPLLGYDKKLNRLGKGKGFYDRFFSKSNCLKIGLAYTAQQVEELQVEPHDIRLNYIVNELGVISENN